MEFAFALFKPLLDCGSCTCGRLALVDRLTGFRFGRNLIWREQGGGATRPNSSLTSSCREPGAPRRGLTSPPHTPGPRTRSRPRAGRWIHARARRQWIPVGPDDRFSWCSRGCGGRRSSGLDPGRRRWLGRNGRGWCSGRSDSHWVRNGRLCRRGRSRSGLAGWFGCDGRRRDGGRLSRQCDRRCSGRGRLGRDGRGCRRCRFGGDRGRWSWYGGWRRLRRWGWRGRGTSRRRRWRCRRGRLHPRRFRGGIFRSFFRSRFLFRG